MPGTIKPADFSQSVNDVNRHRWTLGTIEHVVAAMEGRDAVIEVDNRTGHAVVGPHARPRLRRRAPHPRRQ